MNSFPTNPRSLRAFTLIELLVVIAIIGVLAALLLPAGARIKQRAMVKRTETELSNLATAIESYKIKLGHYPPDNLASPIYTSLYYELSGCVRTNIGGTDYFMTLDGAAKIAVGAMAATFGQDGIVNCSSGGGGDEGAGGAAYRALTEIKPAQYGETSAGSGIRVLGVQTVGPPPLLPSASGTSTPFHYVSSNPTNRLNSFDLWVDILVGKQTNRINNWGPTLINP